ncbi:FAD-binding oxidoreductase [Novosphingobium rosa]|uniref:FAD-binding oxidoreductase n=1 Tax=Novosphingobium rosa TaxID=76978 RepID=UPI000834DDC4|nr:FAD-binding oxidoreductase [Novosphingobium rosa]
MSALLVQLEAIVGPRGILSGVDVASRSCDPFDHVPPASAAILRPASTEELSRIVALCHAAGQPLVMHGGRTGVAGGALAGADELVISLERMARVIAVDPVGGTLTVEAGATIAAVQAAAAEHGLLYPIDLGSKGSATVGGTISTNAGGNRVIRWGMTRHNVLGLEAVLADGTVVSALNTFLKNNTGYDLKQMFIGSEGTLGIVAQAVLRLVPAPSSQNLALVSLRSYDDVLALLGRARQMQHLSAFEVMWQDYYGFVSGHDPTRRPLAPDAPFTVLIETMGQDEAADSKAFENCLAQAHEAGLILDAVMASSGKQIADLWRVREGSEVLVRHMSPFLSFDISVDIRRADDFVEATRAALKERFGTCRMVSFGHLADSNIHIGVHIGPDTLTRATQIEACVYGLVARFGGALTAEHGIGMTKRDFLPQHVTPTALATMRRLRDALDPDRLLNRSVLF